MKALPRYRDWALGKTAEEMYYAHCKCLARFSGWYLDERSFGKWLFFLCRFLLRGPFPSIARTERRLPQPLATRGQEKQRKD